MAAPMVSGVGGVVLAANPNLTADQLKNILVLNADSSIYQNEFNDKFYYREIEGARIPMLGSGTVDLFSALTNGGGGIPIEDYLNSRVSSGCAVVALDNVNNGPMKRLSLILLLFLPLVFVRKTRGRGHEI
jgi:subtilisin family serine protease